MESKNRIMKVVVCPISEAALLTVYVEKKVKTITIKCLTDRGLMSEHECRLSDNQKKYSFWLNDSYFIPKDIYIDKNNKHSIIQYQGS